MYRLSVFAFSGLAFVVAFMCYLDSEYARAAMNLSLANFIILTNLLVERNRYDR